MITPEELRAGPDEKPKSPLPILKKEEVHRVLITNIEIASAYTGEIRGFAESAFDARKEVPLFEMSADKRLSLAITPKKAIGRFERKRF